MKHREEVTEHNGFWVEKYADRQREIKVNNGQTRNNELISV